MELLYWLHSYLSRYDGCSFNGSTNICCCNHGEYEIRVEITICETVCSQSHQVHADVCDNLLLSCRLC